MNKLNSQKPFLLGISGGSASGKSSLSKMIFEKLPQYKIEIINADIYYKRDNMPQMKSPLTNNYDSDWNTPEAIDFDKMFGRFMEMSEDKSIDILIIEGAFIYCYEKLREVLDLKIYLELDSDIRMYRRIKRNMEVRGLSLEEIADYYTQYAKFSEQKNTLTTKIYADVIFNGHNYQNKAIDILINYLYGKR